MSDLEALMWNLEKDPHLSSSFANVTILDRPPDVDRFRRRMERAVAIVPRLRQRVFAGLGRLAPPEWRDADVDLDFHIRRVALPAPADERTLFDLATRLAAEPFDRTRPLWRFTVIDGLDGGRAAMVQQLHHTITDGEGGVRMSVEFLDLQRDQPDPEPVPLPDLERGPHGGLVGAALATAGHTARRQLGITRRAIGEAADLAIHPSKVAKLGADAVATTQSLLRQAAVADPARSPLWQERSLRRRFEVLRVPLDDAKRSAKARGGSINDLFVAAVAGGAGAYHRRRGAEVEELRMAMPISTREKGDRGGNSFTPTRTLVPMDGDPEARFTAIQERLASVKGERALKLAGSLAGVLNLLPTSVLTRITRQQVQTVDFTTSNVRGAPFDLYIAGAHIDANYPMGPLGGTAFNCTLLSSGGWLDMGLLIDTAAVEDPAGLRSAIDDAWGELLA